MEKRITFEKLTFWQIYNKQIFIMISVSILI